MKWDDLHHKYKKQQGNLDHYFHRAILLFYKVGNKFMKEICLESPAWETDSAEQGRIYVGDSGDSCPNQGRRKREKGRREGEEMAVFLKFVPAKKS